VIVEGYKLPPVSERFEREYAHETRFQRRMVGDLKDKDLDEKILPDPDKPGQFISRGEAFDRYSLMLLVCLEVEERGWAS
jgi:hypothetical protein